jgi:hypothetical protein
MTRVKWNHLACYFFSVSAAVFAVAICLEDRPPSVVDRFLKKAYRTDLQRVIDQLPWPSGHEDTTHSVTFDRVYRTGVAVDVRSSWAPEELSSHYLSLLPKVGWIQVSGGNIKQGTMEFCRSAVRLRIGLPKSSGDIYPVSASWVIDGNDPDYCPDT